MANVNSTSVTTSSTSAAVPGVADAGHTSVWRDRVAPALAAFALGAALIYAAGFASRVELHNAAHDGRHAAGFPCH